MAFDIARWRATSASTVTAGSVSLSSGTCRAARLRCTGTPGARCQIPTESAVRGVETNIRLIGVDRPESARRHRTSTRPCPEFAYDSRHHRRHPGVGRFAVVGLSGGGPTLAAAMPGTRDHRCCPGGVVLHRDATPSAAALRRWHHRRRAAAREVAGLPMRLAASHPGQHDPPDRHAALARPAAISPEGDRRPLVRPEFRAMFLDDLLNGSRNQPPAPFADVVAFAPARGASASMRSRCRCTGGTATPTIIPYAHGEFAWPHCPTQLYTIPGESHWLVWCCAEEILRTVMTVGPGREDNREPSQRRPRRADADAAVAGEHVGSISQSGIGAHFRHLPSFRG